MRALKFRGHPNRQWRKLAKLLLVDRIRVNRWACGLPQVHPAEMKATRADSGFPGSSVCDECGQRGDAPPDKTGEPLFPIPFKVRQALRRTGQTRPIEVLG